MLQTLKTLLDDPTKERSVIMGIEINQDAEVKIEEDYLPAEAEIGRNGSNGEGLHNTSALNYEPDNGEYDWSDDMESVDSEPVHYEEEQNEIAETIETYGGDQDEEAAGEIQTIETHDGDQEEEAVREIQMDHGDMNDEEISEL